MNQEEGPRRRHARPLTRACGDEPNNGRGIDGNQLPHPRMRGRTARSVCDAGAVPDAPAHTEIQRRNKPFTAHIARPAQAPRTRRHRTAPPRRPAGADITRNRARARPLNMTERARTTHQPEPSLDGSSSGEHNAKPNCSMSAPRWASRSEHPWACSTLNSERHIAHGTRSDSSADHQLCIVEKSDVKTSHRIIRPPRADNSQSVRQEEG